MLASPFGGIVLESPLEDAWRVIEGMIIKYMRKDPPDNDEWLWIQRLISESNPELIRPDLKQLANHSGDPDIVNLERLHWIFENYDINRKPVNNGSWVGEKFIPNENATVPILEAENLNHQPVLDPEVYGALLEERDNGYKRLYDSLSQFHYMDNQGKFDILNNEDPEVRRLFLDRRRQLAREMIILDQCDKASEMAEFMSDGGPLLQDAERYDPKEVDEWFRNFQFWKKDSPLMKRVIELDKSPASEDFVRRFATVPRKLVPGHASDCPVGKISQSGNLSFDDWELRPCKCGSISFTHYKQHHYKKCRACGEKQFLGREVKPTVFPRAHIKDGEEVVSDVLEVPEEDEGPRNLGSKAHLPNECTCGYMPNRGGHYEKSPGEHRQWTANLDCEMCDGEGKIEGLVGDCPDCGGDGKGEPTGGPVGLDMAQRPIDDLDEDMVASARKVVHRMNQMEVYQEFFESEAIEQTMLILQGIKYHLPGCVDKDGNQSEPFAACNPKRAEDGAIILPIEYHHCVNSIDIRLWGTPWFKNIARIRQHEIELEGETTPGTDYTNLEDRILSRGVQSKMGTLVVILDEFQDGAGKNQIVQQRHDRIVKWWKTLQAAQREFILGSLLTHGYGATLFFDVILNDFDVGLAERQSIYREISDYEGRQSQTGSNILGDWGSEQLYRWLNSESEPPDVNTQGEMEGTLGVPSGRDTLPPFPVLKMDSDAGGRHGESLQARLQDRVKRSEVIPKECERCDGRGYGTKKSPRGLVVPDRNNPCSHCDTTGYIERPLDEDHPEYMTPAQMKNRINEHETVYHAFKDSSQEYTQKRNDENRKLFTSLTKDPSLDFNELARQNNIPPKVLQWVVSQYSFIEDMDKEGRMKELHGGLFHHGGIPKNQDEIMKSDPAQSMLRDKLGMFEGQFRGGKDPGKIVCEFPDGCGGKGRVPRTRGGREEDDVKCLRCNGEGEVSAIRFSEASKELENEIVESLMREYRRMQEMLTVRFIQISVEAGYTEPCGHCLEEGTIEGKPCKECSGVGRVGDPERLFNMMMEEMMKGNTPQVSISNIIKRFSRFMTAARGKQHTKTKDHMMRQFSMYGLLENGNHILLYDPKLHIKGAPLNIDSLLGIRKQVIDREEGGTKEGKFFTIRRKIARMLHNRLARLDRNSELEFSYGDIIGEKDYFEEDRATKQNKHLYISNLLDLLASEPGKSEQSGFLREKLQNFLIPIMHPDMYHGLPPSQACYQCAGTGMNKDNRNDFIPYSVCPRCKEEVYDEHGKLMYVKGTGYLPNNAPNIASPLDSTLFRGWNPSCAQCDNGMHSRITQRGGYGKQSRVHSSSFDTNIIPMLHYLFELRQNRQKWIDLWNEGDRKDPRLLKYAQDQSEEIKHLVEGEDGFITKELGRDFPDAMSKGLGGQAILDNVGSIHEIIEDEKGKKKKRQISMTRIRCPYCEEAIEQNRPPIPEGWGSGASGEGVREFEERTVNSWNVRCGQIAGQNKKCGPCDGTGSVAGEGGEETDCIPCGGTGSVGSDKDDYTLSPALCAICASENRLGGCGQFQYPMLGDRDGVHGDVSPFLPATGCPNDDGISHGNRVGRTGKEMLGDIMKRVDYKSKGAIELMDENDVQWPVIQELQETFPGISKLSPGEVADIKEKKGSIPDALKRKLGNKVRKVDYSPIPPFCIGDYVVHAHERGKRIGSKLREDYPMQDFVTHWFETQNSPEPGQFAGLHEHWSRGKEMLDDIRQWVPSLFSNPDGSSTSDLFDQYKLERLYAIHILFPMHLSRFHRRPTRGRDFMGNLEVGSAEEQKKARKILGLGPPVEENEDITDEHRDLLERELGSDFHRIAPLLMLEKQWEIALDNRQHMVSAGWPKSLFNLGDGDKFITGLETGSGEGVDKIIGELRGLYSDAAYLLKYGYHSPDQHGFLPKSIRFPSMFLFRGNSHMSGPISKLWKDRDLCLSDPESEVYQATNGSYATRKPDPEGKDGFVPMNMEEMQPLATMIWRLGMGVPSGFENSKLFKNHQDYDLLNQYPLEFPDNQPIWMQQLWFRIQDELLRAAHNPKGSAKAFDIVSRQRGRTHPSHLNGAGDGTVCGVCDSTGEMFARELLRHLPYQKDHFKVNSDTGEKVKTHILHGRDGEPLERNNSGEYTLDKRALEVVIDHAKPFLYGEWEDVPGFDPDNLEAILEHRLECPGCDGTHICSGCTGDGGHRITPRARGKVHAGLEMLGGFARQMAGLQMNIPYEYRDQLPDDITPLSLRVDEDSALWRDMDEDTLDKCGYDTQLFLDEDDEGVTMGGYTPPFGTVYANSPTGKRLEVTAPWQSRLGMGAVFKELGKSSIDLYGDHPPWGKQPDTWEALSAKGKQEIREKFGHPKEWRDGKVTEEEWNQIMGPEEEGGLPPSDAEGPGERKHHLHIDEDATDFPNFNEPNTCEWGPDVCHHLCPPGQNYCGPDELEIHEVYHKKKPVLKTIRATGYVAPNHQQLIDSEYMKGFDGEGTPTAHFHGGNRGIARMIAAGFKYVGRKAYGWAPWFEMELKKALDEDDAERRAELEAEWGNQERFSMEKYQRFWERKQIGDAYRQEFEEVKDRHSEAFHEHIAEIYKRHTRKKNPIRQKRYEEEKMRAWDERVRAINEAREDIESRYQEDQRRFFHSLEMEHMWIPYFTHPHSGNIIYSPFDFDGSAELPAEPRHLNRMLHNLNMRNAQHKSVAKYQSGKRIMSAGLIGIGKFAECPNCQHRLPGHIGNEGSDNTCPLDEGGCGMVFSTDDIPSKDWTSRHGLERVAKPVEERKILRERLLRMTDPEQYADEGDIHGIDPALVICTTCHDTGEIRDPTGKRGVVSCPNCIYLPDIDPHLPASGHPVYGNEDTGSPTGGHYVTFSNWNDALMQYHRPNFTLVKGNPDMVDEGAFRHISDGDFPDVLEALGHGSGGRKPNALLTATAEERKLFPKHNYSDRYIVKDKVKAKAAEHLLMALLDGEPGTRFGVNFEGKSLIPTICAALFSNSYWAHPKYKEAKFSGVSSIANKVNEINKYFLMAGGGEDYSRLLELSGVKSLRKLGLRDEDTWDAPNQRNIPGWKTSKTWKKKLKECQTVIGRLKGIPDTQMSHHDRIALADAEELLGLLNPPNLANMFDHMSKSNVYWLVPDGFNTNGVERDTQETLAQGIFRDKEEAQDWLDFYVNSQTHKAFYGNDAHAFGVAGMEYVNEMERLLIEKDGRDSDEIAHLTPAYMYSLGRDAHQSGEDGDPHLKVLQRLLGDDGPMLNTPEDYKHDHIGDTGYWRKTTGESPLQGVPTPATPQPEFEGPGPSPLKGTETVEGDSDSFDVRRSQKPIDHAWDSILKNINITQ